MENANIILENSKDVVATFTTLSLDAIIIIAVFILFFGYGLKFGKDRIISLILSFYFAFILYSSVPYLDTLTFLKDTDTQVFISKALIFLIFLFISNFIIKRFVYTEFSSKQVKRFFEAGILSVGATILTLALYNTIAPAESVYNFGAPISNLFSSADLFFWWLVAPLAILFFTVRR